jgi:hypothetical protein
MQSTIIIIITQLHTKDVVKEVAPSSVICPATIKGAKLEYDTGSYLYGEWGKKSATHCLSSTFKFESQYRSEEADHFEFVLYGNNDTVLKRHLPRLPLDATTTSHITITSTGKTPHYNNHDNNEGEWNSDEYMSTTPFFTDSGGGGSRSRSNFPERTVTSGTVTTTSQVTRTIEESEPPASSSSSSQRGEDVQKLRSGGSLVRTIQSVASLGLDRYLRENTKPKSYLQQGQKRRI